MPTIRQVLCLHLLAAVALWSASASAETFQNDQHAGGRAEHVSGLRTGDVLAGCFTASGDGYPVSIDAITAFIGDGTLEGLETPLDLRVYDWADPESGPGATLFEATDVTFSVSATTTRTIDVSDRGWSVSGPWCVGWQVPGNAAIVVASDTDGFADEARSWVRTSGAWQRAVAAGVTGDLIVRTEGTLFEPIDPDAGFGDASGDVADGDTTTEADVFDSGVVIDSVLPEEVVIDVETEITITGSGLSDAYQYFVGSERLVDVFVTGELLASGFLLPNRLEAGTYDVEIRSGETVLARAPQSVAVVTEFGALVPSIESVTPSSVSRDRTTELVIVGANFVEGATLRIGSVGVGSAEVTTASTIQATVSGSQFGQPGTFDVRVENPDGAVATLQDAFTVLPPENGGGGGGDKGCAAAAGAPWWALTLLVLGARRRRR